jgi:hypothetical protein
MKTHPTFPTIPPPADALDDGECRNFATIGKTHIQQWCPGPEYKTQLLIEDTQEGDEYDMIPLDITCFPDFNRFNFSVEAMSKKECLRILRKIMQVVKALPAVGIPQPMSEPPAKPLALMQRRAE